MSFPIRCFTCSKVIANKIEKYEELLLENKHFDKNKFFRENKIERYCCKRMFLGYVPFENKIINLKN